jgi:hypothetical protein
MRETNSQAFLQCDYKPVICPNAENGCTVNNLTNRNMDQHISECLYQYIHCPNNMPMCQPVLRKDLSIHENDCSSYACPFATEGCPYIGTLNSMIIHRDGYCGRLHKKIQDLEEECKRLNTLIHDVTIGLNIKLPSTPATAAPIAQDTSMDNEMALFHQMFNSDPFGSLDLNNDGKDNTPVGTPMDLLSATTDMSFLDNNTTSLAIFSTENNPTSPQPLQFIPPMTVPKRTSNGKKIRYSKNVRLAHSAIRIARQRTASSNTNVSLLSMNPSNDAILNNLDIAKQKLQQQQQTITFKNLDDVTQFLNNEDSNSNMSRSLSSSTVTQQKKKEKEKKRNNSITSMSSTNAVKSPMQIAQAESPRESISSPSSSSNAPPKRRPMFILASSYLSNYNSANSPTNNNDE